MNVTGFVFNNDKVYTELIVNFNLKKKTLHTDP